MGIPMGILGWIHENRNWDGNGLTGIGGNVTKLNHGSWVWFNHMVNHVVNYGKTVWSTMVDHTKKTWFNHGFGFFFS